MLIVSKITKDKRNFYKVAFSNGETIKLSEDLLVRYRLLKGQEVTEADFEAIKQKIGYDLGLQLAMNYLSYQMHSEQELFTYLKQKEIAFSDQKKIAARLKELDILNDRIYGESYVRTQIRLSDKGPVYLGQQLRQKGLSNEDIAHALKQYPLKEQLEIAVKTGEKVLKRMRNKSFKEQQQKLKQQLMHKGFSQEIIQEVVRLLEDKPTIEEEYEALANQGEKLWSRHQRLEKRKRNTKIKQNLFQKGFDLDSIQRFLDEKEDSI